MLRSQVLLCHGEDRAEWAHALKSAGVVPEDSHVYRGIEVWCDPARTYILAPFGSAAVEAVLWELTRAPGMQEIVLWGTAGGLPGGAPTGAVAVRGAEALWMAHLPDGDGGEANMASALPDVHGVSTDRFYGASPAGIHGYHDAGAWHKLRDKAGVIDMETAAFYAYLQRWAPDVKRVAVRCVANPVAHVEEMPLHSEDALASALAGALQHLT